MNKKTLNLETLEFIEVPELGIKITPKQHFNGKTYSEILEQVDESKIATYSLLVELSTIAYISDWKKYPFMKYFCAFVPYSKAIPKYALVGGYDAWFIKLSKTYLGTDWMFVNCKSDTHSDPDLGVFLYQPLTKTA